MKKKGYQPTAKAQEFRQTSLTKVLVYFGNREKQKYYSRDQRSGSPNCPPDLELGLFRLRKMIAKMVRTKHNEGVVRAIIYCNVSDQKLYQFEKGAWQ